MLACCVTTQPSNVIFVPQSNGSKLVRKIEEAESELGGSMTWNIKVIEQSGTPLALMFTPKFQMEFGCHRSSIEPPRFKWKVRDQYPDALRRQISEGLHIIQSGTLNKKCEFNSNITCRLQVAEFNLITDKQLKRELESRREFQE